MREQVTQKAWSIAQPIIENEGLELVDVEYLREGSRWVLRFYIDKPDQSPFLPTLDGEQGKWHSGVGLEDCQRASHAVEMAIDVADLIPHEYSLEVSSPGIERSLTRPEHFSKFVGRKVKIKTFSPLFDPPRKNFKGILISYSGDVAEVEVEGGGRFSISRKEIAKARLQAEWD